MSTHSENKLKSFLRLHKPETVCLASWLESIKISHDLQKRYRKSGWLESLGHGAFIRPGDDVQWQGGLYALQVQAKLPVHVGALAALDLLGLAHYLRLGGGTVFLFSPPKTVLPSWFRNHAWGPSIKHIKTSFLPENTGLMDREGKTFSIRVSAPERAILECLYLAPDRLDIVECFQLMEGLPNLRPKLLQELLENCSSIKVKRLFLYMADKAGHQWMKFLNQERLDLGKGDRSIVNGGTYIAKFRINIPRELAAL